MQTALVADGNGPAVEWKGGSGTFAARGTFGSGTLKMQYCPGDASTATSGNWVDVADTGMTAAGQVNFSLGNGYVRAVLSGSTAPSITYDFLGFMGRSSNWGG